MRIRMEVVGWCLVGVLIGYLLGSGVDVPPPTHVHQGDFNILLGTPP